MRLPTWDELSSVKEQLDVLEFPLGRSLFVVGPPGSGKTVLAMYRAQQVAEFEAERTHAGSEVAIVTFNRMLRRLLALINESEVEVYTMQEYIWHHYWSRTREAPPRHEYDRFSYVWNDMLTRLGDICERPDMAHLVVDEAQDLPQDFFTYIYQYASRTMTVFADEDQALHPNQTTLEEIQAATGLENPIILQQNHRNTPEIARLAEHFHRGRLPVATVLRQSSNDLPCLVRSQSLEHTAILISNWCKNRGGSIGVIVNRNDTGSALHSKLAEYLPKIRIDIYRNDLKNEESINVTTPGVTILNKKSVKGQEFDTVFVLELEDFIPCVDDAQHRAMYMMCTRARDHLFLVYGSHVLTPEAEAALPGPAVLERP